jgi:4,5-dihydroxyphthalate decarboxylase
LSLACGPYDRVRPLLEGLVTIDGVDLTTLEVSPASELFWRMLRHEEFDVAELSMSNYIMEIARDIDRFVAIPVFPHRSFRHSSIWVLEDSELERPEDLAGRRIGIPEYSMTMMLFTRGFLADDHGVSPSDVNWVQVRPERIEYDPPDVAIENAPADVTLDGLLRAGDVDAIVTTRVPEAGAGARRLFRDPERVEAAYYQRTRIFPIMHLVVVRRPVFEANRWLAASLMKAFEDSKAMAYGWLHHSQPMASLPWFALDVEREWSIFGGDPFPYGIGPNLPTLAAALRWSFEQGLSARALEVDDLFPREALDAFAFHHQR